MTLKRNLSFSLKWKIEYDHIFITILILRLIWRHNISSHSILQQLGNHGWIGLELLYVLIIYTSFCLYVTILIFILHFISHESSSINSEGQEMSQTHIHIELDQTWSLKGIKFQSFDYWEQPSFLVSCRNLPNWM